MRPENMRPGSEEYNDRVIRKGAADWAANYNRSVEEFYTTFKIAFTWLVIWNEAQAKLVNQLCEQNQRYSTDQTFVFCETVGDNVVIFTIFFRSSRDAVRMRLTEEPHFTADIDGIEP